MYPRPNQPLLLHPQQPPQSRGYPPRAQQKYPGQFQGAPASASGLPGNQKPPSGGYGVIQGAGPGPSYGQPHAGPKGYPAQNAGTAPRMHGAFHPQLPGTQSMQKAVNLGQIPGQIPSGGHPIRTANPGSVVRDPLVVRKQETDKLIKDCYSKFVYDNAGRQVPEISYQTHINIKEYSQFPSLPPPLNLPAQQLGSVKDRVLVICAKASGRVILQKGKYNETKDSYQIGRTWDMDELKVISRVGNNGLTLSLNKEYYWKIDDGIERMWKFLRILAVAYGNFVGSYPKIVGWSIAELKLPASPPKSSNLLQLQPQDLVIGEHTASPELIKSKSIMRTHIPSPVLPPQPPAQAPAPASKTATAAAVANAAAAIEHYKNIDFTSQGKLPMKPMVPLQVDRGGSSTKLDHSEPVAKQPSQRVYQTQASASAHADPGSSAFPAASATALGAGGNVKAALPSFAPGASPNLNDTSQDSQNFVFEDSNNSQDNFDYSHQDISMNTTLRASKQRSSADTHRKVSETLESVAAIGLQLGDQLNQRESFDKGLAPSAAASAFSSRPSKRISAGRASRDLSDFGIEEVEDSEQEEEEEEVEEEQPLFSRSNTVSVDPPAYPSAVTPTPTFGLGINNNTSGENDTTELHQEIDNFMESHLAIKKGSISEISSADAKQLQSVDDISIHTLDYTNDSNLGLNVLKREETADTPIEKDPEIEEILDEVNWNISDDAEGLIKKLTKELNRVKFNNVKEVIGLDFSSSNISNDLTTSLNEIENLQNIFKKIEVDFKELAPEVLAIENNSEGLQVESVNKKILYNDLQAILGNLNIDSADLQDIETFSSFERLNRLEEYEIKLSELYDALMTMRSKDEGEGEEGLSSMRALKQYKANYEKVTDSFVFHFKEFIFQEFTNLAEALSSDIDKISTHGLTRELNNLLIYSGFMFFVKDVSKSVYFEINGYFNQIISDLFDTLLTQKLNSLKKTTAPTATTNFGSTTNVMGSPSQSALSSMKTSRSSRSLRLSTKTKFRLRGSDNLDLSAQIPQIGGGSASPTPTGEIPEFEKSAPEYHDSKALIDLVAFSKDLISIVQYFIGSMFHYDSNNVGFVEYLRLNSYAERRRLLDNPAFDLGKSYSNDIIPNLTAVFGNYINVLLKKVFPFEGHVPLILCYLETLQDDNKSNNQEFLLFNFLKRAIDKFKATWTKMIKSRAESLNHSIIVANVGLLPAVKNFSELISITESSFDNAAFDVRKTLVRGLVDGSYQELIDASTHLFMRNDPLLKNSEFDEKEKQHRYISILQNVFYLLEQFSVFQNSSDGLAKLKRSLDAVFKKVEDVYFKKLLHKNLGKLVEFVDNYETLSQMGGQKKYNKKVVKSLVNTHTNKDISQKAHEFYRKLEKHYVSNGNAFEKDLLDKLWRDMEAQVTDYFERFGKIIRMNFDREIDYTVTKQEIHLIFSEASR